MKKLILILGAFLCVSLLLVSCGNEDDKKKEKVVDTPESDAKKSAECVCEAMDLMAKAMEDPTNEDLQKDSEKLEKKCKEIGEEMEGKYEDQDSEDTKKYLEALEKEMENCA